MAQNVASILERKTNKLISIHPDSTVMDALILMDQYNIGSLIVMDGEKYKGVMSERDYSRKVILKGKHSQTTLVSEIMNTTTPTVTPDDSIEDCMALVSTSQARYLPVLEKDKVVGILSILDLVEETSRMYKESADSLRDYITST